MQTNMSKSNFKMNKFNYWFIILFSIFLLIMLLVGQFGSLISYQFTVNLGLQESVKVISKFGVAMNKGFSTADTIIYIPILIFALVGFIKKRKWSIVCMAGAMAITAYWPIACLATLLFAKGTPNFYFTNYITYSLLLVIITIIGLYNLLILCLNYKKSN